MKRLDQRGWGLGIMLVFICVFIIAIVIISVQASKLGISGSNNFATPIPTKSPNITATPTQGVKPSATPSENISIIELEKKMVKAADLYRLKYYASLQKGDNVTVTVKRLMQEGMLDLLTYTDNKTCSGYVIIKIEGSQPYLKCGATQTNGYLKEFDS